MNIGMLWFDNDPRADLKTKIQMAAKYYREKYGEEPNLCFVHPSMVQKEKPDTDTIVLRLTKTVMPHHLWIGVDTEIYIKH